MGEEDQRAKRAHLLASESKEKLASVVGTRRNEQTCAVRSHVTDIFQYLIAGSI